MYLYLHINIFTCDVNQFAQQFKKNTTFLVFQDSMERFATSVSPFLAASTDTVTIVSSVFVKKAGMVFSALSVSYFRIRYKFHLTIFYQKLLS